MPRPPATSYRRSVFVSYLRELGRLGILGQVRDRVPGEVQSLIDDPLGADEFIDAGCFDHLLLAVGDLRGRDTVRAMGYQVMKNGFAEVLEPIIHFALYVSGGTPHALFSRAHIMAAIVSHGMKMEWHETGPRAGRMRLAANAPVPAMAWAAWEGCGLYLLELAGTGGYVDDAQVPPDGLSCEIAIRWK
ncbi:MAG TPA: hypothetical protein VLW85_12505 [Myxococcales bacterium]|nr:hypothetical protein [Myxococcales bacterium]